jgi:excisionase family DNA binding protein
VSQSQITPIFVSVKEAARMLSLTTWSVYKLLDEQAIKSQYHGRRRLVSVESLHEYAESLPTTPAESA